MYELHDRTRLFPICNVPLQIDNQNNAFSDVFPLRYPSSGICESQSPEREIST